MSTVMGVLSVSMYRGRERDPVSVNLLLHTLPEVSVM